MKKGQRRDTRKKLLKSTRRSVLIGEGGRVSPTLRKQRPARAVALGGPGRMAAGVLLRLLLITKLFGARMESLCVIRAPVESVLQQPPGPWVHPVI